MTEKGLGAPGLAREAHRRVHSHRRGYGGVLLDEAPLRLAEEEGAVGDQPADVGLGAKRGLGGLDAVEPDLADAVPGLVLRMPTGDRTKAQTAEAGEAAHDVGMR